MKLLIGLTPERPSELKNSSGESLLEHTLIIYDEDQSTEGSLHVVYESNSTFTPKWKSRDVQELVNKANKIIKAISDDPSMLDRDEISYKINPTDLVVKVGDQYENDCKVYQDT